MDITLSTHNDILVMNFNGKLDTSTAPKVEAETVKQIESHKKIIINLQNTTFVSSAGLRIFLATAKRLAAAGGKLRICHPNEVVLEILEISGFTTILDIKNTLDESLAGF
jgi:anti-sigma B factor antagonist